LVVVVVVASLEMPKAHMLFLFGIIGTGAKLSRNCVLLHTPSESPDLQVGLNENGFNGNRLSLWVLQVVNS
jgi:hypothetical protein